uniref:DUF7746 domain-containing protein n=1 Tax=Davidia involucrata TaxID=16924 RepID=A0A5B7BP04_DAVIN
MSSLFRSNKIQKNEAYASQGELIDEINRRLNDLKPFQASTSSNTITKEDETIIQTIESNFQNSKQEPSLNNLGCSKYRSVRQFFKTLNQISNFPTRKNYPRPIFPEIQYDMSFTYRTDSIYVWNINGMSEFQILKTLQAMTKMNNDYKLGNRTDLQIANAIVNGFTGMLQGWWNNYLTDSDKNMIETAVKRHPDGIPILNEQGQPIQYVVPTLIFSIAKNFIGDPSQALDRSTELLSNLRCPKLQDFEWYEDVFMTRVMLCPDCNQSFWKKKFINGLPSFFSERVKHKIRELYNGKIPYSDMTYRDLINLINKVYLQLCSERRLQAQVKKHLSHKNWLEDLSQQFGYSPIRSPSSRKYSKHSKTCPKCKCKVSK